MNNIKAELQRVIRQHGDTRAAQQDPAVRDMADIMNNMQDALKVAETDTRRLHEELNDRSS